MLSNELGKDIDIEQREQFLKDNCDKVEEVTYTKYFSPEELAKQREDLTDASIKISDLLQEKKEVLDGFKERMKPLEEQRQTAIKNLKDKAMLVTEDCFKFLDEESKKVGYYDKLGNLVYSRSAFPNELQTTIFVSMRKDGTNN